MKAKFCELKHKKISKINIPEAKQIKTLRYATQDMLRWK